MEKKPTDLNQKPEASQQEPETAVEQQASAPQPEAKKPAPVVLPPQKKNPVNMNKFKRGGMTTLMTVVFIAIVVALNVVVSALTQRFPSMDIDLTAQGLNSLSDQALEIAGGVDENINIYLIGSQEAYEGNQIYSSYGLEYSQVSNLAFRLQEANSQIHVEYVDPDTNPTFISEHAGDNLATGMVLVESSRRSTVLTLTDLFSIEQNSETYETESYSMVDSALASALEMVSLDKVPVLALVTGHGEMLGTDYIASFVSLMENQNFQVEEVDLLSQEIPEDTQVLMIGTPVNDYSAEEVQKLRDYMDDTTREEDLTLLVTCYPSQEELPNLYGFLEEWGVRPVTGVVAESDTSSIVLNDPTALLVQPSTEVLSDNTYERLVSYYSAPLELVFTSNNDISVQALWTTSDTSYVITNDMTEEEAADPETGSQVVATLSSRAVDAGDAHVNRRMVVFGSSNVFTDSFMNTTAFGDSDYVVDLLMYATGTDGSNVNVVTNKVQTNVLDVSASTSTVGLLGIVFTAVIPLVILAVGLAIFLKRRHL